jgi:hypothetical protein
MLILRRLLKLRRLLRWELVILVLWWRDELLLVVVCRLISPLDLLVLLALVCEWTRDGRRGHGLLLLHLEGLIGRLRLAVCRILAIADLLLVGLVWRRHCCSFPMGCALSLYTTSL